MHQEVTVVVLCVCVCLYVCVCVSVYYQYFQSDIIHLYDAIKMTWISFMSYALDFKVL